MQIFVPYNTISALLPNPSNYEIIIPFMHCLLTSRAETVSYVMKDNAAITEMFCIVQFQFSLFLDFTTYYITEKL